MTQILYFTAGWCPSCQNMAPAINQLEKNSQFQVRKVDVDYDAALVERYNVRSIPTVIIMSGGEVVKQQMGAMSYEQLMNFVNS
jgi:thioredoxin-like negative regulator of GroEL